MSLEMCTRLQAGAAEGCICHLSCIQEQKRETDNAACKLSCDT